MKLTLLYSKRSSETGKNLITKFRPKCTKVFRKRSNKRFKADVILRWGSTEEFTKLSGKMELNTLEAVKKASNKLVMMQTLVENGLPTPKVLFNPENNEQLDEFRDENGGFFVRDRNDVVRYDDEVKAGDKYVSKSLENKRREYRVHVFNGEIIAIYEKVPNNDEVKLFKAENCSFELRNPENCRLSKEDQETCIKAVNSLGLLFGGVDLMRDKDKKVFISEVNSAPSLNGTNIDRYVEKISDYINAMRG